MHKPKIAVLYFPGNNCEEETKDRCIDVGMEAKIIRWNSSEDLSLYDGYIIPGGFSYEDRIRSGVIAAKEKIIDSIRAEAKNGKPLLGICNGAQVLVESGLIPGLKSKVEMALAPNINPFVSGYYCGWVYIKSVNEKSCAYNMLHKKDEVMQVPIAHGEGRFTTKEKGLVQRLIKNKQVIFQYCDKDGKLVNKYPINPNGSVYNIAAISNKEGNIMAIMPHPERASYSWQLPDSEKNNKTTNSIRIFESMKKYIYKN